jgi:AAHS family 4-hydroxybenzoate transporter-like MFS transporter
MTFTPDVAGVERPPLRILLDDGPWTAFQKRVLLLASATVVLDGFDIQLLGFAIPALIRDWGLTRAAFVPVIALSLIAMSAGTAAAGVLGDRYGRRPTLIASVAFFGLATIATAFCGSITTFSALRILAALGLGGAMPNAVALLAEFTPRRRRSFAVTFSMICMPVGGLLAGLVSASVMPLHGWQAVFVIGGLVPLLFTLLLAALLPESPDFLLAKPRHAAALSKLHQRFGIENAITVVPELASAPKTAPGYRVLFAAAFIRDTLLLWAAFFCTLTAAYCVFNWIPTLLSQLGFDLSVASSGLAMFNFGGIAGALVGALTLDQLGSRGITRCFALAGAGACVTTGLMLAASSGALAAVAALFAAGFFIAGLQPMLFALCANVYPDYVRATGVGAALAVGRLGAICSSVLGAVLIGSGATAYFGFLAVLMCGTTAALVLIRRHVPPRAPLPVTSPVVE